MSAQNQSLPDLWAKTVDMVKDRINNRSLWETLEQSKAITIENDKLIIGLRSDIINLAGHLKHADHRNTIENIVSHLAGKRLSIHIIDGDTMDDWHIAQQRDARVVAMHAAEHSRNDRKMEDTQSWDGVYEYITRTYATTSLRSLPQVKARFMSDMLYALSDVMDQLYPENPDENTERLLAKAINKIADNVEVPGALVALELERLRAWKKQSTE